MKEEVLVVREVDREPPSAPVNTKQVKSAAPLNDLGIDDDDLDVPAFIRRKV